MKGIFQLTNKRNVENRHLLIVDDDLAIQKVLMTLLSSDFTIFQAYSYQETLSIIQKLPIDFILLDIQLQDGNGFDLIYQIKQSKEIPIIFVSVLDDDQSIIRGLEAGADDYVTKPFSSNVLKARINHVIKRKQMNKTIHLDDLYIDLNKRKVFKNQEEVHLTYKEEMIFWMLVEAKGRVITRNHILESVWDEKENYVEDNTLSVTIRRLKNKIGKEYIQTKRNVGYFFQVKDNE